jgi:hypothetical protein
MSQLTTLKNHARKLRLGGLAIMTSNRPVDEWGKLLGDVPAAGAILDRLLHRAEIIAINGRSHRLAAGVAEQAAAAAGPTATAAAGKRRNPEAPGT